MSKKAVVFDFDGVIHSYSSGWKGDTVIPDPPVPGIKEAIADIMEDYLVVVVSTRCATEEGKAAIEEWLHKYGIEVDEVTKEKPPAICYIDDRAICFDGRPELLRSKIEAFKPWYQAKKDIEEQVCDLSEFLFRYPVTYNTFWKEDCDRLAHLLCSNGYSEKREGEWEIVIGSNGKEKMVCTNCRHGQDLHSTFTYCPNCGARMRGVIRS